MPGADVDRNSPWQTGCDYCSACRCDLGATWRGALHPPLLTAPLWPWALTPLTARAIGAWLIAIGAGMAQSVWENIWTRADRAVSFAVYGALQLVAVARYPETINWTSPQAWLFALFPVVLLVSGGVGLARGYVRPMLRTGG